MGPNKGPVIIFVLRPSHYPRGRVASEPGDDGLRRVPLSLLRRFVYNLDIPLLGGRVPFHKTIFELVKRVSQDSIPDGGRGSLSLCAQKDRPHRRAASTASQAP